MGDFDMEFQIATMNKTLCSELETIFLMTDQKNYFLSSSLVKEIWSYGQKIDNFVSKEVLNYFNMRK